MSMGFEDSGELKKQGNFKEREPYWDANIKWFTLPADNEPHAYRLIAKPAHYAQHWIPTVKKDGTAGKNFAFLCKNYDSINSKWAENGCKVCEFIDQAWNAVNAAAKGKPVEKDKEGKIIKPRLPERITRASRKITMASNAIIRELQAQGAPGNNTGSWTYVHPIRLPSGAADEIVDKQNKFGVKKPDGSGRFGFNHKDHGKDILITMNPNPKTPAGTYVIDSGVNDPVSPLTADEMAQQKFLVNFVEHIKFPKDEDVEQALKRNGFEEWLEGAQAQTNLQQISKSGPPAGPAAPPSDPGAFDDGGGIQPSGENRGVPNEAPAQIGNFQAPAAEDDVPVDVGQLKGGPAPTAPAAAPAVQAAPAQPAAAAPAVAAQPATPPVKAAPAAAKPAAAAGGDLSSKIQAFVAAHPDKKLVEATKEYDPSLGLRFYKVGLSIPSCFTKYSENDKAVCRGCPVRLDCMMTDG
jgi:hypothetical protein